MHTDLLGSIERITNASGAMVSEYAYTPWGGRILLSGVNITDRGYTGHEHLSPFGDDTNSGFCLINMNGRIYDPVLARFLSPDPYVQSPDFTQSFNRYSYCWNNPFKYTDPSGEFLTWNIGSGGFSIGLNFTPILIPLGFGINVGWSDGFSSGVYGEVGYRVGGSGFGSGVTVQQSIDYNFKHSSWSTTTSEGAYASFGPFNAGVNFSQSYNITSNQWSNSWGVSVGIGFGNDARGIGFNVGYGSNGFTYGMGGFYNSHAWDSNPDYAPDEWNDGLNYDANGDVIYNTMQSKNNCYSYALDDFDNGNDWGLQPGYAEGEMTWRDNMSLENVKNAALSDGRIKVPNFLNKLGFGKRGYYEVYLVVDNTDGIKDYHWYRQDKGGYWSQKHGIGSVNNVDGSGRLISNPAYANHNYGTYPNGTLNYNGGGLFLWVKRR